jgi:hypothetical protein
MDVGRMDAAVKPTGMYWRRSMEKTSPDRQQPYGLSPVYVSLNKQ